MKDDVRARWLKRHRELSAEAESFRASQDVPFELLREYDARSSEEKTAIHEILAEWLQSSDNRLRYDASFIISQRRVRELAYAVLQRLNQCEVLSGPEARFEAKKLRRILDDLK